MKSDGNFWKWSREQVCLDVEVGMLAGVFGPWRMRTETEHLVGRKTQSHLINLRAPFGLYS